MNQPAPPNPAQVLPTLWASLTMAQVMIVGIGFFLAHQQGVTPTFAADRLLPGGGIGAICYGLAFVVAVAAVVVPPKLAALARKRTDDRSTDDRSTDERSTGHRSDAARAMMPFILHMAFAEVATLLGFVGAIFMTQPPVPERLLLPAAVGLCTAVLGFPTASRLKSLAGR
jgi:hypothetical protein